MALGALEWCCPQEVGRKPQIKENTSKLDCLTCEAFSLCTPFTFNCFPICVATIKI
jgi:hypothetical protein